MINGLGLFAALGASEPEAAPQPQAGDPALFAAALVAALGLKQPVQVVEPAEAQVTEQDVPEEGDEAAAEGQTRTVVAQQVTEQEPVADVAPVLQARVTPDAEAIEETKTLGAVLRSVGKKPAAAGETATASGSEKGKSLDRVSDEPARPMDIPEAKASASRNPVADVPVIENESSARPDVHDAPRSVNGQSAEGDASPDQLSADHGSTTHHSRRKQESSIDDDAMPRALPSADQWSTTPPPGMTILPPAPQQPVNSAPAEAPVGEPGQPVVAGSERQATPREPLPRSAPQPLVGEAKAPAVEGEAPVPVDSAAFAPVAPPQSNDERTSRAIAENTRLGRQLAELLGEHEVTEFKMQLAPRRASKAPAADLAMSAPSEDAVEPSAPVVWRRVMPAQAGDTISGQMLPQAPSRELKQPTAPSGTFAREALTPQPLIQNGNGDGITLSGVTSRSEIVRMVANASRAMSPNLTQAEASPAVAKTPAPSVVSSLPVVRQELPEAEPLIIEASGEDPKRRSAREAAANDATASSATGSANYSNSSAVRSNPPEARDTREARNLPSQGSTDQQAAGSADRVTLQVADDEGRQTRIRVTVTGGQIRAVITPPDSASARQLEQRMDQLHETLVRAGFVDPKVVVRAAPETMSDIATMANGAGSNQDVRSAGPAGKDQPAGEQRQGQRQGQREQDRGDGHRHPQGHSRERDPRDRRR